MTSSSGAAGDGGEVVAVTRQMKGGQRPPQRVLDGLELIGDALPGQGDELGNLMKRPVVGGVQPLQGRSPSRQLPLRQTEPAPAASTQGATSSVSCLAPISVTSCGQDP